MKQIAIFILSLCSLSALGQTQITTKQVKDQAITYAKFQQLTGLSIFGRSANSSGVAADITAATDHNILRRSGTSIGFGSINLAQSGAVGSSILGAGNGGSGIANSGTFTWGSNNITFSTGGSVNVTLPTSGTLSTQAGAETLTNKRITPRVQSVSSSATVTPSWDNDDGVKITAQAAGLTLANPSGTPTGMQAIIIRIKDNGTIRTIAYGTQYRAIGITLPTATVASKTIYLGCIWNADDSKVDVVGMAFEQ